MPAPVLTASKAHNKATTQKPNGQQRSTKTRIVRRRGPARGAIDSDDELEREARSDSGSDDDKSSIDSDSDGDSAHVRSPAVTPSTTQSPQVVDKPLTNGNDGPFAPVSTDWSDMVTEESSWATLPIIDFNTLETPEEQPKRARKARKADKKPKNREPSETPQEEQENVEQTDQPVASTSHRGEYAPRGRSAREAYQTRLQADPSYVPTVGEFWGHDDRLLDKDLRSLSGWWRGKWQGRGRGGFRGRGAGYFAGPRNPREQEGEVVPEAEPLPPIDRTWGHDGFEEMKKREDHRRQPANQDRSAPPQRGIAGFRGGRGGFVPGRGRGGFNRGGLNASAPRTTSLHNERPWFAMKPERMWTKQLDWFLHSDPALKPRPGQGQGFRVKLTGNEKERVVRKPPRSYPFTQPPNPTTTTTQSDVSHNDNEEHAYVVRLPKQAVKGGIPSPAPVPATHEPVTTAAGAEESLEEVFTVKPRVPARRDSIATLAIIPPSSVDAIASQARSELIERAVVKTPPPQSSVTAEESAVKTSPTSQSRPSPTSLPPIQTVFSPAAPQPQNLNASYTYAAPALPPGVAMNPQGMTYEIATGRPVYLQGTPPPLFDPRPVMASHMPMHAGVVPFVPGHIHHHSNASPDYLTSHPHPHSHSRTPSIPTFLDPVTGMPMFSMPRQNSRIEIRRPTDQLQHSASRSPPTHPHRPSGLRTTVSALEDAAAQQEEAAAQQLQSHDYYPSIANRPDDNQEGMGATHHPGMNPNVMAYQPYQPYYYPEYGYPPYVDPSQMQYDMYQEHHTPQPTIYY